MILIDASGLIAALDESQPEHPAAASIVVLAERHRVYDVLTLDERHFRVLRAPGGRPFRILPADAEA